MKQKITAEDLTKIEDQASASKYFLTNKRFEFIRDYMLNAMKIVVVRYLTGSLVTMRSSPPSLCSLLSGSGSELGEGGELCSGISTP